MPEYAQINRVLNMPQALNMSKFWIWQSSEYGRVLKRRTLHTLLKMSWQSSEYISGSKYARTEYGRILNIQKVHKVLNLPQYDWIGLNSAWICLNMSELTIINVVLSMSHTIHSARSLYRLTSTFWEIDVFKIKYSKFLYKHIESW